MNRRIIISEDEKLRILSLHENRKLKEWNLIMEQETTQIKDIKDTEFAGDVQSCRAAMQSTPINNIPKFGISFQDAQKKWKEANCNGSQNCIPGKASFNQEAGYALCEGKFPGQGATQSTTASSATGVTFAIDNKPTVLNTDQEITDMVKNKKITANTLVFKSPEIPTWTKISALPDDSPIKKAIMGIIATVPPDLPGETFKIIGADGKQVDMDTAAIEKGLMDKTINAETPALDPKTNTWSKVGQIEALKPILAKVVPDYTAPQTEMPSTGNKTLDEWLKTQAGQTYLSKKDRPSQEAFIDYLEQSGDPIIASVGGKEALRGILLGDVNKDTKFGRWLQKGANKLKNVGKVLKGKDVVANTGYNPNQPGQTTGGGGASNPNTTNQTTYSPEEQKKFMDMASQMKLPRN